MLQTLFSWPVVGPAAVLTIGIGIGVLSMTPPRFRIAEVCYSIAATVLLAKVATWIITEKNASIAERFIVTFLIFGGVGLLWCEAMRWVESMTSQLVATAPQRPESHESSLGITGDLGVTSREPSQQPSQSLSAANVPQDTQKPGEKNPKTTTTSPIEPKEHGPQRVATGMTPTVGIMVQRGGKATPSTEFEYISNGLGAQAANIGAKPLKVWFAPSGVTLEAIDLPKELTINGNKVKISEFTETGFAIDDHGVKGIKVAGIVLEGTKSASEQPPTSLPQQSELAAPGPTQTGGIHLEQHGGPNAATFGDNSPITLNAIPTAPPERTLSREKFERLVTQLSGLSGSTVNIGIIPVDDETVVFGEQLRKAFQLAGWNVSLEIGKLSQTTWDGTRATVFEGDGFNCDADAKAPELANALKAFEAVGLKCTVRSKGFLPNEGRAALAIVIGKRNP